MLASFLLYKKSYSVLFKHLLSSFHPHSITYVVRIYFSAMTLFRNTQDTQGTQGRKFEARSRNRCFCGKATRITHSECVPVASGIQHELRMCRIFICGLVGCTTFLQTISQTARFPKRNCFLTQNVCFWLLYISLKHFSFQEEVKEILSQMYVGLHVKCLLSLSD